MARRQQFDTDQVLKVATQLFWRDGYRTTTVRDLVKATGVAESSLYHAFGGKRRLFEASLDRYRGAIRQGLRRLEDFDSPAEGLQWYLMRTVGALSSQEDCRGCMVTNTTIELAPHDAAMQRELRAIYAETEETFCRVIGKAQAAGEISATATPRMLARFLLQNLEGLRVLAKSDPGADVLREMGATTLNFLFEGWPNSDQNRRQSTQKKMAKTKRRKRRTSTQ